MKKDFRDLCIEIIEAWDSEENVEEIINEMRLAIAVSPSAKKRRVASFVLPSLPDFAEPYRSSLQLWWERRCRKHKNAERNVLSSKTIAALELARKLDVLKEFCEEASEKDWASLGFAGFTEFLLKLERDKKFASSGTASVRTNSFQPRPTVDMEKHPSYRPLINQDEEFVF